VLVDGRKLRRYNISIEQVAQALGSTNLDVPAGYVTESEQEYLIRAKGRFNSTEEIENVRIPTAGERTIEIRHVARVVDGHKDRRSISRFNGGAAVVLSVQKQSRANDVQVADQVRGMLPKLAWLLPAGAELRVIEDESEFVRGALSNVRTNMLLGILLTAVTLFLFLSSGRATAVVAVVMPSAVVATFTLMMFSGLSVNILTLLALAISIGIVVNNSILVLENTVRFIDVGHQPQEAAVAAAADIALPVFSTTATNLVVFLPIAFMGEIIGRFFREFGLTIVYVTVLSLAISFSLTPMMCGLLLRRKRAAKGIITLVPRMWQWAFERVRRAYLDLVERSLRHPGSTLLLCVLILAVAIAMGTTVGGEFLPETDEGKFHITVETPAGTTLEETDAAVRQVEAAVRSLPYLEHYYTRVGQISGFLAGSSTGVNIAEIGVTVADRADRPLSLEDLLEHIRPALAAIPSAKVALSKAAHGPGGARIEVEISGDNLEHIRNVAADIMSIVEEVPGTASVGKSWQTGQPELRVLPDQKKANQHRIAVRDVAMAVRTYVEGREVSEFRDGDEDYDIRVRLRQEDRRRVEDVERFFVRSPETGQMVRIGQVAELTYEEAPTLITRKDRRRFVSISSQLTGTRSLTEVVGDIRRRIGDEVDVPEGVEIGYGGETEGMRRNFKELFKALGTAAVLTFLCTAGIVESFSFAAIIILSLPLSLVGVILAMMIGGVSMNIFSLMAMIMLVGMVVNNAIIIIDYASRAERAHLPPAERVKEACRVRFRVIVIPAHRGGGDGRRFRCRDDFSPRHTLRLQHGGRTPGEKTDGLRTGTARAGTRGLSLLWDWMSIRVCSQSPCRSADSIR